MAVITKTDLENAKIDAENLADFVNAASGDIVPREGANYPNARKLVDTVLDGGGLRMFANETVLQAYEPEMPTMALVMSSPVTAWKFTGSLPWVLAPEYFESTSQFSDSLIEIMRPFDVSITAVHPALLARLKDIKIFNLPEGKHLRFGNFLSDTVSTNRRVLIDIYIADNDVGSGTNAALALYFNQNTNADQYKGDTYIELTQSGSSGVSASIVVKFEEDGSAWTSNLSNGTFENSKISVSAIFDDSASRKYLEANTNETLNSDPRLLPGARYVPFEDGHSEAGSPSAILGYPNFLSKFIKGAHDFLGFIKPYPARIIFTPTLRQILIKDAARNTTGARYNDPTGSATPSVVKVFEYDLASNVGLEGTLELDWSSVPAEWLGSPGVTLNYTPAQSAFHESVYFDYASFEDYLQRDDHQVVIPVGYDKASFTGSINGNILTVADIVGRLTPGLLPKDDDDDILPGTTIVAYSGVSAGGNGDYLLNVSHPTVAAKPMTAGRQYTTIADAMADPRCDLGTPSNKIAIRLDQDNGTIASPTTYPAQFLALKAYVTIESTGWGARIVPVNPANAQALIEMLLTSKIRNLSIEMPNAGYGVHTRPGASGGPGGYGAVARKMQGIFNVLFVFPEGHSTRAIAGDASTALDLLVKGCRFKNWDGSDTGSFPCIYMHNSPQNATYPNLAQSEGMRLRVIDCANDVGGRPLVEVQSLDDDTNPGDANPFGVTSTLELYGNTPGSVLVKADTNGDHAWRVIGIHGGTITAVPATGGGDPGTPEIEVSQP